MKPYYKDEAVTIYHGDAREVLPTLETESVDLVLTDPPFFMPAVHYQSSIKWQRSWGDVSALGTFWAVILDAMLVSLKATGHMLSFCNGDSYPVFYPEMYRRFDTLKCLVWDKGHAGFGRIWRHQHELIIAGRWADSFVHIDGQLYIDVIRANAKPSVRRDHPVEKPLQLLAELIRPVVPVGGLVLDSFMGSGTTLLAAKHLGHRAIGIETEERYCEIAARKVAASAGSLGKAVGESGSGKLLRKRTTRLPL